MGFQIIQRGNEILKVETMSASNPSDTELILSKIDDKWLGSWDDEMIGN